jgi:sugar transferase (PEP-CTERM/EpsH1 system associated)
MRILLITSSLPYPLTAGSKIRVWNLLQIIASQHEVTLLSLLDSAHDLQYLPDLEQHCARVEPVVKRRRRSRVQLLLRLLRTMLRGQPTRNGIAYYEELEQKVREVTASHSFDVIQIEQSHMAPYIEFVADGDDTARLITLYDTGATQYERILKVQSNLQGRFWTWLDWLFLRHWEPAYIARHFDKCIVVSQVDEGLLHQSNPVMRLAVIPNGVNTAQYSPLPEHPGSKEILFVGKMNYAPNVDGVLFFYREIFPLIRNQVPQARLLIVGSEPVAEVQSLARDPAVEVTGYVEDTVPYYQRACLSAVSLRAGSGTRLKILESMALGRSVVSTTLGCEGLAVTHGENILVADTQGDFAAQTIRLLNDEKLRRRLVVNGRRLVETCYDWEIIGQQLLKVYGEAVLMKKQRI